jgi:hypothetical protein
LVNVARRETEPLQATPSTSALIELPVLGVGVAADGVVNVTLKTPAVIAFVPVAPEPATADRLNAKVPVAPVDVRLVSVIDPLPIPTAACQLAAGLPTRRSALAVLNGPSAYVPVPAAVGVSAKLSVVLLETLVPPMARMPFVRVAVIEVAVTVVPSTLKLIDEPEDVDPVVVVEPGAVVLLLPPPQAIDVINVQATRTVTCRSG